MFDPSALNDLAKRLTEALPADFQLLRNDLEKNFHAILQSWFTRMNLVSREEFEVQGEVLAQARKQLEALEQRLADLESRIPGA